MVRAVERAHEIGATALQVFGDNPTAWRRRARRRRGAAGVPRAPDASSTSARSRSTPSYLINLAGPDATSASGRSSVLAHELRARPGSGAVRQRPHRLASRHRARRPGSTRLADGVGRGPRGAVRRPTPDAPMLVLENSAGSGGGSWARRSTSSPHRGGHRRARRRRATRRLLPRHRPRLGRGLPTCPSRTRRRAPRPTSTRASGSTGWSWSTSTTPARSGLPRRSPRAPRRRPIGAGGPGRTPAPPAPRPRAFNLETPGMDEGYDAVNVARARDLAAGPPRDLPPEASGRPGGRAQPRRGRAPPDRCERRRGPAGTSRPDRRGAADRRASPASRRELAVLPASSSLAAAPLPRPGDARPWDGDQGHDMLVLLALVPGRDRAAARSADVDRRLPSRRALLLPARAGGLAQRRRPDGPDRVIALFGIATVAVTWWLARSIGGPVAGAHRRPADGGLAGRDRGVDLHLEPEPHRALARDRAGRRLARRQTGASRPLVGRGGRRSRGDDAAATSWGASSLPPIVALLVAPDSRRARPGRTSAAPIGRRAGLAARRPASCRCRLRAHDGFEEIRARLAYLRAAASRPRTTLVRVLSSASGHSVAPGRSVTDSPLAATGALAVIGILVWRWAARVAGERTRRALARPRRCSGRAALAVAAPPRTVVPGLPNDHYHAFVDPIVFIAGRARRAALADGLASVARPAARRPSPSSSGRRRPAVGFNLRHLPQAVPNGGWPAAARPRTDPGGSATPRRSDVRGCPSSRRRGVASRCRGRGDGAGGDGLRGRSRRDAS